jgi:hypothetical protein
LMCLRLLTENDNALYDKLKPPAMKLGWKLKAMIGTIQITKPKIVLAGNG